MHSTQIQNWLQNEGGFIEGLALLTAIGHSKKANQLKVYLDWPLIPEKAYSEISQELRGYLMANPVVVAPVAVSAAAPAAPSPKNHLHVKATQLLKERDGLRAQLVQMVEQRDKFTEAERGDIVHLIMKVQADIDEIYQRIEQYENTGELPEAGSAYAIQQETIRMMNRMGSLRSAISRLKKKLQNPPNALEQQQMEGELLAKQVELKDIARALHLED